MVVDLIGFAVAFPRKIVQDWTGDYAKDLSGNRIKRIFDDPVGLKAARACLAGAEKVRPRAGRSEFLTAGVDLSRPAGERGFLLQTYARDTGEILSDFAAPVYVGGQRWGSIRFAYTQKEGGGR